MKENSNRKHSNLMRAMSLFFTKKWVPFEVQILHSNSEVPLNIRVGTMIHSLKYKVGVDSFFRGERRGEIVQAVYA